METIEVLDNVGLLKNDCEKFLAEVKNINNLIRQNKNQLTSLTNNISLRKQEIADLENLKGKIIMENDEIERNIIKRKSELANSEGELREKIANCEAVTKRLSEKEKLLDSERKKVIETQESLNATVSTYKKKIDEVNAMLKV